MFEFRFLTILTGFLLLLLAAGAVPAGWQDFLKPLGEVMEKGDDRSGRSGLHLSQQEMAAGLREALSIGTQRAVEILGRNGGYLNDALVKIPLPDSLNYVEKSLRAIGQEGLADDFVASMNLAAERAVPEAAEIFSDTIKQLSLQDAKAILTGPEDAATQYFRQHSGSRIEKAMLPIIKQATASAGVTSAYKRLIGSTGFLGAMMDTGQLDLDTYVTEKAMDGLFLKLAAEEAKIRKDPLERSTALLQEVFGSVGK